MRFDAAALPMLPSAPAGIPPAAGTAPPGAAPQLAPQFDGTAIPAPPLYRPAPAKGAEARSDAGLPATAGSGVLAEPADRPSAYLLYEQPVDEVASPADRAGGSDTVAQTQAAPAVETWHPPDDRPRTFHDTTHPAVTTSRAAPHRPARRARQSTRRGHTDWDRTTSLLVHLSGVLTGCLLPAVLYLMNKNGSPYARWHSAEAVNFQLTLMLGYVSAAIVGVLLTGFLVLVPIWLVGLVLGIQAAIAAETGTEYHYPFTVRFVA